MDKNKDKSKKENIDDEEKIVLSLFKDLSSEGTKSKILNAYRKIKNKEYDYSDAAKNDPFFHKLADAVIDFFTNIRVYKDYQNKMQNKNVVGPLKDGKVSYISVTVSPARLLVHINEHENVNIVLYDNEACNDLVIYSHLGSKILIDFK